MRPLRRSRGVASDRLRSLAALVTALALVAGCQSAAPTSSPPEDQSPSASAAIETQPVPTEVAARTASPGPAGGNWEPAGMMTLGRVGPQPVALSDGGALVVGNDTYRRSGPRLAIDGPCLRGDSSTAEIWDPATGNWRGVASLNKPRGEFAAVALRDGRVLVTGGVNPGVREGNGTRDHESYSSTYLYDPRFPELGWSRGGLLGTARTAPAAAVLADGRVLVAGGYYLAAPTGDVDPIPGAVLAANRAGGPVRAVTPADVDPPVYAPALATAELYDPATDSWSATGPLHYARPGAAAVTLADGRVLVVGSAHLQTPSWNFTDGVLVDDHVYDTAEVYDPRTGRFSMTAELPPIDVSALADLRVPASPDSGQMIANGTLVALDDGGALLVGRTETWFGTAPTDEGVTSRSLRFDPGSGQWSETDRSVSAVRNFDTNEWAAPGAGISRLNALVARLSDGRILVAGGEDVASDALTTTDSADLYDPGSDTWSDLPPMPGPRAGGIAVSLSDGSVLIGGGYDGTSEHMSSCEDGRAGLATAIRFFPTP